MNANEIRWNLHNYDKLKDEIKALKGDIATYRLMDGVRPKIITDMPTIHSTESAIEKIIDRLDYVESLKNELDQNIRLLRAINSIYFRLEEPKRTIIEMRYFITPMKDDVRQRKYNWAEIAEEVGYTEQYCREIDCKIILQISNKILEYGYKEPTKHLHTKDCIA